MFYCEQCNMLMPDSRCTNCGKKKLREVESDDFCFFVALETDRARYFEENLKMQDIPVASLGVGLDLRTRTSKIFKIYIPYCYFDKAKEVYNLLFGEQ